MLKNNRDFLFISDATLSNPNGDPDSENKPRMDVDTKTLLVSDVRLKRNVRDFLSNKGWDIFVSMMDDKKVTMENRFDAVKKEMGKDLSPDEQVQWVLDHMIDIRMFGSAFAIGKINKAITGPIQLTWGYSLHPVDLVKSSSIVTIMNDNNSTFGKMYKAEYAMIAHSGIVNKFAAKKTGLSDEDVEIFSRALIQSMMNNLTHSKQGQQPLLYLEVIYDENFDGYLGDLRRFLQIQLNKQYAIRKMEDVNVDFSALAAVIDQYKEKGYIKAVRMWQNPLAAFANLPEADELDLLRAVQK